jgi:hypothetical protein
MKEETNVKVLPTATDSESRDTSQRHPSRNLEPRAHGYGIGGGYERPYRQRIANTNIEDDSYGPLPHSGYYGAGAGSERFEPGKAGFKQELNWYKPQYGERTSGRRDEREP